MQKFETIPATLLNVQQNTPCLTVGAYWTGHLWTGNNTRTGSTHLRAYHTVCSWEKRL